MGDIMNRTRLTTTLTAFAAATLVAITGCGSTVAGTASAGTVLTTSSATSTTEAVSTTSQALPTETEEATSETESADTTTDPGEPSTDSVPASSSSIGESDPTSGTAASDLDAASVTWIRTFCTGFANVAKHTGPDTTGMSKSDTIRTVVDGYGSMADAATAAVGSLSKVAKPEFPGHEKVAPAVIDWFKSITTVYGQGAKTIANGAYSKPSDLSDAIAGIEAKMSGANDDLGTAIGTIDPSVSATIRSLPECKALASGH